MLRLSLATGVAIVTAAALVADPASAQNRGQRERGQPAAEAADPAAAQAALTQLGSGCVVGEARLIGRGAGGADAYEVVCQTGPGYLVTVGEAPEKFNCLAIATAATDENASVQCSIPGNLDAAAAVQPLVQSAQVSCTVEQAAWRGQLTAGGDRYEVACAGADGYFIDTAVDGVAVSNTIPCLDAGEVQPCQLTTPEKQLAGFQQRYGANIPAGCTPNQLRVAGANAEAKFYEITCNEGAGYFIRTLVTDGSFDRAIACADAMSIGDGCALTDTTAARAAAANQRGQQLAALGVACQPTDTRLVGTENGGAGREVVEFACSDKPTGVVAFLSASDPSDSEAFDCITASLRSLECSLTPAETLKTSVQAQLDKSNEACPIGSFLVHGRTDDQNGDFIEIKCADDRALFGQFPHDRNAAAADVMICARARLIYGFECEL